MYIHLHRFQRSELWSDSIFLSAVHFLSSWRTDLSAGRQKYLHTFRVITGRVSKKITPVRWWIEPLSSPSFPLPPPWRCFEKFFSADNFAHPLPPHGREFSPFLLDVGRGEGRRDFFFIFPWNHYRSLPLIIITRNNNPVPPGGFTRGEFRFHFLLPLA